MKVYSAHCTQNIVNTIQTSKFIYNITSLSTIVVFWLADTQRVVGPMAYGVHQILFYGDLYFHKQHHYWQS